MRSPAASDTTWTRRAKGALADMQIGDPVTHAGRRYILRGLEPMSVPDRRADLEDAETGELIRVLVADIART
ncbi:MAG: hypothetical protein M3R12_01385 [Actinomycetota bacterium]|nr:hypothetical protein [Actinomycetota bacterium]